MGLLLKVVYSGAANVRDLTQKPHAKQLKWTTLINAIKNCFPGRKVPYLAHGELRLQSRGAESTDPLSCTTNSKQTQLSPQIRPVFCSCLGVFSVQALGETDRK